MAGWLASLSRQRLKIVALKMSSCRRSLNRAPHGTTHQSLWHLLLRDCRSSPAEHRIASCGGADTADASSEFACTAAAAAAAAAGPAGHRADVAVWLRPIPVGRYILYNTNLSSWRAAGASTVTVQQVQAAVTQVTRSNPNLPVAQLLQQRSMQQLFRTSAMVDQQLAADQPQQAGASEGQQQPAAAVQQPVDGTIGRRLKQTAAAAPSPSDVPMATGLTPFPAAQPADDGLEAPAAPAGPASPQDLLPAGSPTDAPPATEQQQQQPPGQGSTKPPDWREASGGCVSGQWQPPVC